MKFFAITAAIIVFNSTQPTQEHERITKILQNPPKNDVITIEYRPVANLDKVSSWHIKDTKWWVRLQPADVYRPSELDKKRKYKVTGVVLDHAYGCVNIWVKKFEYTD